MASSRTTPLRLAAGLAAAVLALVLLVQSLVLLTVDDLTDDYVRRFMAGTVSLMVDELAPLPPAERAARVRELDERFAYPVLLRPPDAPPLTDDERVRLAAGDTLVSGMPRSVLVALPGTPMQVLVLGPFSRDANPEHRLGLPREFGRALLVGVMLAGAVGLIAFWLLRPAWRDLRALRRTADALADGRFDTPMPALHSKVFAPLAEGQRAMLVRLAAALAAQRELTGAVSHELRTPLARLRFAIDALAAEPDAARRDAAAADCERDLDELEALIDASLTFARLDSGALQARPEPGDLSALLHAEVRSLQPLLEGRALTVQADLPGAARFDARLLPYALRNGLRNAARHARDAIAVQAWQDAQGRVCVAIDDDGPGVPESQREAVFQPFRRLDGERERRSQGFGLGLAIVRRVMLAHGGEALMQQAPSGGARLLLRWPG
ncbi:MAG: two-component sensor histidine kinase [Betaproteobacteria bacterium]|nr:two-component sensor histidine kinase [Betaproteobacteria bacterium]